MTESEEKRVGFSRREFLGGSAALVAGLYLTGCSPQTSLDTVSEEEAAKQLDITLNGAGEWRMGSCFFDCGGRCMNKGYVVDGVIVRQKTDDTHPDSPEYPQQRACNRGRSWRYHLYNASRVKYPLKRKNWQPGGGENVHAELRGRDEWERISWDEAIALISEEMLRIKKEYGNSAFCASWRSVHYVNVMNEFGGYTDLWGNSSLGSYTLAAGVLGAEPALTTCANDRFDFKNCETVILFADNCAWSSPGSGMYYYLQGKKAGMKFYAVDPIYNDTYAALDAEWIPIRPGTDAALMLGMCHVLITEDDPDSNPMLDWDFIDRCTLGFDADHMPEGEDPRESFKDYVLGTYDGTPKTPEWASEICGASVEQITLLAREMTCQKKVGTIHSWAPARTTNGDSNVHLSVIIGAITGHMGKSGHFTSTTSHNFNINNGPYLCSGGLDGQPAFVQVDSVGFNIYDPEKPIPITDKISMNDFWQVLKDGHGRVWENGTVGPCEDREVTIKADLGFSNDYVATLANMGTGLEVLQTPGILDFFLQTAMEPNTSSQYADIVLPFASSWERTGDVSADQRDAIFFPSKVIEPLYEAKTDRDIAIALMKGLGLDPENLYPLSETQAWFNKIAGSTVINKEGTDYVPLATITEDDIEEWGVEGKPQEGVIGINELVERGNYQVERYEGDPYGYIAYEAFREDPEANPQPYSASGKIEIFCRQFADLINSFGYNAELGYPEQSPIPKYFPAPRGYEETFSDWDNKVKGEYPFQCMSVHSLGRAHTSFQASPYLREVWTNPLMISSSDAAEIGISTGDTVLITSTNGKQALRLAFVSERIMPGVLMVYHGSLTEIDEETGIDKGANENHLYDAPTFGQGICGYNSMLFKIEPWAGEPLVSDAERPVRVLYEEESE